MRITQLYKYLLKNPKFIKFLEIEAGADAKTINPKVLTDGLCDVVSYFVSKNIPGSEMCRVDITLDKNNGRLVLGHSFVLFQDKYYDYSNPNGVHFPSDLKYIQSLGLTVAEYNYVDSNVQDETEYLERIMGNNYKLIKEVT